MDLERATEETSAPAMQEKMKLKTKIKTLTLEYRIKHYEYHGDQDRTTTID